MECDLFVSSEGKVISRGWGYWRRETRLITRAHNNSQHKQWIDLRQLKNVSYLDAQLTIRKHSPTIVHLICEASKEGGLILFASDDKTLIPVSADQIVSLFAGTNVKCVVLNCCENTIAQKLLTVVDLVVFFKTKVKYKASDAFSQSFYKSLLSGIPFEVSFATASVKAGVEIGIEWSSNSPNKQMDIFEGFANTPLPLDAPKQQVHFEIKVAGDYKNIQTYFPSAFTSWKHKSKLDGEIHTISPFDTPLIVIISSIQGYLFILRKYHQGDKFLFGTEWPIEDIQLKEMIMR